MIIKKNYYLCKMILSDWKKKELAEFSKEFEREANNLKLFLDKYNFDVWDVWFLTEHTIQIADYFVSPKDINFDIETKQPKEKFFDWYDLFIEEKIKLDYQEFCKKL